MNEIEKYYEDYWKKRLAGKNGRLSPIRDSIPSFLVKYTQYGSVVNLVPKGAILLDLGCGEGNITELYRIHKGCETHALEVSEEAIRYAKARGVEVIKWNLNDPNYPHPDNSFDTIVTVDVPEHLINPLILLNEAYRMLKPGGRLILQVPNLARLANRFRMLFIGDPRDVLHWGGYGDGMEHLHWFTKPKLEFFIRGAGFRDVTFHAVGLPFDFIYGKCGLMNWQRLLLVSAVKP